MFRHVMFQARVVSAPEEEPYSTIFGSLKHPIRRKILRMLSEKPRSFSEMLEASAVSSSHLTYHLENLGELVSKTEDGKYSLSTFGEAAVATMSRIEETPKATEPKHLSSLPLKWKFLFVALLIGLVTLAGISYTQYEFLNKMSEEYGQLPIHATPISPNVTLCSFDWIYQNGTKVGEAVMVNIVQIMTYPNGTTIHLGVEIPYLIYEIGEGVLVGVPDPDYDMQSLNANSVLKT